MESDLLAGIIRYSTREETKRQSFSRNRRFGGWYAIGPGWQRWPWPSSLRWLAPPRWPRALRSGRPTASSPSPDNGLLTLVMQEFGVASVHHVTNPAYWRPGPISYSFHGRDIFTPTAARIASGWPAAEVGPEITDYITLDITPARREGPPSGARWSSSTSMATCRPILMLAWCGSWD